MIRKLIIILLCMPPGILKAQELNCIIQIESGQIENVDKSVFEALQSSIYEFMNNRRWTKDVFSTDERIECTMLFNITDRISNDEFRGTLQIQSRRPVFGSSYSTTLLNHSDNNIQFKYVQFQTLEYSENAFIENLTSILAFYAYMIIGLDYDSFSSDGGTPYFQKALAIVNNAQNARETGWKAFEDTRNRYWLADNMLNPRFASLRKCMYRYHRLGFDKMSENVETGRREVSSSLHLLKTLHENRPNSFNMQIFFNAKADELVNLFSQAPGPERTQVVNLLNEINPGNTTKYQKILRGK